MSSARSYHHGDLRRALIDAGLELARSEGPDAVILRAAARRAGVSHNASYRHFADRDALLRAVAERGMSQLALRMEDQVAAVVDQGEPGLTALLRFRACGLAYVDFALSEPGWFRAAFAVPRGLDHLTAGQGVGTSGMNPYEMLGMHLDELVDAGVLPPIRRPGLETVVWASVHGLSTLLVDGPLREIPQDQRDRAVAHVIEFIARGI